jgi:histidyl-tRNA synthetase
MEGPLAIQAVRGMKDVLPPEVYKWQAIEAAARQVFSAFGFQEVRVPVLERTELFARSIGQATDIVEKEMYTFTDRGGDSLTLRPEATAGVLRAFLEHKLHAAPGPHKFYTMGPMFRHERPQKGRLRQFHQLNAEVLGDDGPQIDAELMVMLTQLLHKLGLAHVTLEINSLGCPVCRPGFRQALIDFFTPQAGSLCEDCRRRLSVNPLRVLDCKAEGCRTASQGAPEMGAHLCAECSDHFAAVRGYLDLAGVGYELAPRLVRGLDYYVRTTFEAKAGDLGAQNAVAGGGRYDGLVTELGGPPLGCIGFAAGLERLALIMPDDRAVLPCPDLFIAAMGAEPRRWAFAQAIALRAAGLWVELTGQDKSLKAQMRRADKLQAQRVLIVGEEELKSGRGIIKNMRGGEQHEVALSDLHSGLVPGE